MNQRVTDPDPDRAPRLFEAQWPSLLVGIGGLLVCLIVWFFDPYHALRAYLYAWLLWLGVALGSMALVMLHCLTGGWWGWVIRRPAEAAAMTLPLLLVLFIPLALGLHYIYPWADPAQIASHAVLRHRQSFFAPWFVLLRTLIYFAIWIFWAWRLRSLSLAHDEAGDAKSVMRLRVMSGAGFVVYFATMSSAAMDWIASREVDWYSSTFGLVTILGQAVIATAFVIIVLALLWDAFPLSELAAPDPAHDLGNLLLTNVVLWSYVAFAEFLVIWIGNSQEDNTWYYHRMHRGWNWAGTAIILLHFAVPFVMLLFQQVKRNLRVLACVAGGIFLVRIVHVLWMVAPSSPTPQPHAVYWLDFIAPFGVGGVWFALFLWLLRRRPLMPLGYRVPVEPVRFNGSQGQPA
jgi:hypothetical protein